jgi:hypothetical protein
LSDLGELGIFGGIPPQNTLALLENFKNKLKKDFILSNELLLIIEKLYL